MSNQPLSPTPSYFKVARPAHFTMRYDLLDELCVPEEMMRLLPKTEEDRRRWLRVSGQPPEKFPLADLLQYQGHAYKPTERYIFQCAVLPGNCFLTNIIHDGRGWGIHCDHGGLFAFVFLRAIQCAIRLGTPETNARAMFLPPQDKTPATVRRAAPYSIGFADGTCTILAREHGETEALFLAGQNGYFVPFMHTVEPNL